MEIHTKIGKTIGSSFYPYFFLMANMTPGAFFLYNKQHGYGKTLLLGLFKNSGNQKSIHRIPRFLVDNFLEMFCQFAYSFEIIMKF
jgi:hypothetical protein